MTRVAFELEAVILQGGKGSRLGGVDKSRLEHRGRPFIEHLIALLKPRAARIRLSVAHRETVPDAAVEIVADEFPGAGPLGGIAAALSTAERDWSFVVACDMPLLSETLLDALWAAFASMISDAVTGAALRALVPRRSENLEPLCAFYHRDLASSARRALAQGRRGMHRYLESLPEGALRLWELPESLSTAVFNVNTHEDYRALSETSDFDGG